MNGGPARETGERIMLKSLPALIAACFCLFSGGAFAGPPQILALIETPAPVPLTCEGGTCQAELSAFCLQHASRAPGHGTPYVVAGTGKLDLILQDADGKQRRLPAMAHLELNSVRGYAAVAVSLPRQRLAALGAVAAMVAVGRDVSLLPKSLADGRDAADAADLALATGPWRRIGRQIVEEDGARIDAVKLTNALINLLPRQDFGRLDLGDGLWRRALAGPLRKADPAGLAVAREALDTCTARMRYLGAETVRLCLQLRHDAMMDTLTRDYWKAVDTGA